MTISARLKRLESRAGDDTAVAGRPQVLIVDRNDARKTNEPVDHNATLRFVFWDNGRDPIDLRIWGDPAYAINWGASEAEIDEQTARQRAHLGLPPSGGIPKIAAQRGRHVAAPSVEPDPQQNA